MIGQALVASGGRRTTPGLSPGSDPQKAGQSHPVGADGRRVAANDGHGESTRHDRRDGHRHDHGWRADVDRGQP